MKTDLKQAARRFAADAHSSIGQLRKYTGEPYIVHPAAVASLVEGAGGDDAMVAAAWLHDVVEDTPVTLTEIHEKFGPDVGTLVGWLTDVSKPEDGNRAARKKIDLMHISQAPARAQAIKLADLIDNSRSIIQHDPDFSVVYLGEKEKMLAVISVNIADHPAIGQLLPAAQSLVKAGQTAVVQRRLAQMDAR